MSNYEPTGSLGEQLLQKQLGTTERAADFYERQVHPHLTPAMREFIARQTMVFLSTADSQGACDSSFRSGPPGFCVCLDDRTLIYPEYRGNGVLASAGNMTENPHLGVLFVDFTHDHIGLHVNGTVRLLTDHDLRSAYPHLPSDTAPGRHPHFWVRLTVEEAYVHCSKHIPHLEPAPRPRPGSDRIRPKDNAYFIESAPSHRASDAASAVSELPRR